MNLKPLSAALVGAGVAVVGTAGAFDLPHWIKGDTQVAAATPQEAPAADRVVPPAPMTLAPGQVPNYRAIVRSVAETHAAMVALARSPVGGLRVEVRFAPERVLSADKLLTSA